VRHPKQYLELAASPQRIGGENEVAEADTGIEFMMNALRLLDGFALPLFARNTGSEIYPWQKNIDTAIADGLLTQSGMQLRPTERGINFLDDLLERFMPDDTIARYPVIPLIKPKDT